MISLGGHPRRVIWADSDGGAVQAEGIMCAKGPLLQILIGSLSGIDIARRKWDPE